MPGSHLYRETCKVSANQPFLKKGMINIDGQPSDYFLADI
jgi:hypothetical protein